MRRIDFAVKIAQATAPAQVNAKSAALQTDMADVHSEMSAQQVVELPCSGGEGKNFQSFLYLLPDAGILLAARRTRKRAIRSAAQTVSGGAAVNVAINSGTTTFTAWRLRATRTTTWRP